jgi:hypothetical protein
VDGELLACDGLARTRLANELLGQRRALAMSLRIPVIVNARIASS